MKPSKFSLPSRLFHWIMAPLLLAMLLIGVGMVATVSGWRPVLVGIHQTLGLALLALAILRLLMRLAGGSPALPASMPAWQHLIAKLSHWVLYGAMLAMPFLGWGMLSAAGYPLPGIAGMHLPPIAPQNVTLYAWLRATHGFVGEIFFATIVLHIGAGLLHALLLKDGVFDAMSLGSNKPR
ncbi:MAG TPA: cytochrome b/b6 domain-containing protein [Janthinobacterium sp.]|jgi:cytochrome b561|nr:cytochrome b/b6 domain-containing protein [Janthinobacterium sp.]